MQWLNNGKEILKKDWEVDNEYRFPISGFGSGNECGADSDKDCRRGDNKEKQKKDLEE